MRPDPERAQRVVDREDVPVVEHGGVRRNVDRVPPLGVEPSDTFQRGSAEQGCRRLAKDVRSGDDELSNRLSPTDPPTQPAQPAPGDENPVGRVDDVTAGDDQLDGLRRVGIQHADLAREAGRAQRVVAAQDLDVGSRRKRDRPVPGRRRTEVLLVLIDPHAGITTVGVQHVHGPVCRRIVDDDELPIRHRLGEHRVERGGDEGCSLIARNADRDSRHHRSTEVTGNASRCTRCCVVAGHGPRRRWHQAHTPR